MERFINQQNLTRYRELLMRVTDPEQRRQIALLVAEEEARYAPPRLAPVAE